MTLSLFFSLFCFFQYGVSKRFSASLKPHVEAFLFLLFQIIRERIPGQRAREGLIWNTAPGALVIQPTFSDALSSFPFYLHYINISFEKRFTAVIYSQLSSLLTPTTPLYRLIKNVAHSKYVARVS